MLWGGDLSWEPILSFKIKKRQICFHPLGGEVLFTHRSLCRQVLCSYQELRSTFSHSPGDFIPKAPHSVLLPVYSDTS